MYFFYSHFSAVASFNRTPPSCLLRLARTTSLSCLQPPYFYILKRCWLVEGNLIPFFSSSSSFFFISFSPPYLRFVEPRPSTTFFSAVLSYRVYVASIRLIPSRKNFPSWREKNLKKISRDFCRFLFSFRIHPSFLYQPPLHFRFQVRSQLYFKVIVYARRTDVYLACTRPTYQRDVLWIKFHSRIFNEIFSLLFPTVFFSSFYFFTFIFFRAFYIAERFIRWQVLLLRSTRWFVHCIMYFQGERGWVGSIACIFFLFTKRSNAKVRSLYQRAIFSLLESRLVFCRLYSNVSYFKTNFFSRVHCSGASRSILNIWEDNYSREISFLLRLIIITCASKRKSTFLNTRRNVKKHKFWRCIFLRLLLLFFCTSNRKSIHLSLLVNKMQRLEMKMKKNSIQWFHTILSPQLNSLPYSWEGRHCSRNN